MDIFVSRNGKLLFLSDYLSQYLWAHLYTKVADALMGFSHLPTDVGPLIVDYQSEVLLLRHPFWCNEEVLWVCANLTCGVGKVKAIPQDAFLLVDTLNGRSKKFDSKRKSVEAWDYYVDSSVEDK